MNEWQEIRIGDFVHSVLQFTCIREAFSRGKMIGRNLKTALVGKKMKSKRNLDLNQKTNSNHLVYASHKYMFASVAHVCALHRKAQRSGPSAREGGPERKEAKKERKSKGGLLSQ